MVLVLAPTRLAGVQASPEATSCGYVAAQDTGKLTAFDHRSRYATSEAKLCRVVVLMQSGATLADAELSMVSLCEAARAGGGSFMHEGASAAEARAAEALRREAAARDSVCRAGR